MFTINTIMVGLGQGLAVRAMTGRVRWRILVLANLFFAASFVVLLGANAVGIARAWRWCWSARSSTRWAS